MSTMTAPSACTCLNQFDHCAHCQALEAAVKSKPTAKAQPVPKPPRRPYHHKPAAPPEPTTHQLINAAEVARLLSIGPRTLWRLVQLGRFIQPARFTRKLVRWNRADVLAWIEKTATAAQAVA